MIRISETSRLGRMLLASGAAVVALTLAVQLYLVLDVVAGLGKSPVFAVMVFLSFFTILTNIWFLASLLSSVLRPDRQNWLARPRVKAALVVSLAHVGWIYALVFRGHFWNPTGVQWVVDGVLHYATPLMMLAYWVWFVPKGHLRWRDVLIWALYPLTYFVLSQGISGVTGYYPYPFLDAGKLGTASIVAIGFGLGAGFCALGVALVAADRRLRRTPYRLLR